MEIPRQQSIDNTSAMGPAEAQMCVIRISRETYEHRAWLRLSRSAVTQWIPYALRSVKTRDGDSNYRKGYLNP